jgi:tRNA G18 (ribose-2'-O)-methylase SpoU
MDFLVHIPLAGPIGSLNVSAAGAIVMGAYFQKMAEK